MQLFSYRTLVTEYNFLLQRFHLSVIFLIFLKKFTIAMPEYNHQHLTQLLNEITSGNKDAIDEVLPIIYSELKSLSSHYLNLEYKRSTIQTTELVHEAYIKLIGSQNITWQNRAHFFFIAAKIIRQILVDRARKRKALKRGGEKTDLSLEEAIVIQSDPDLPIIELDEALKKLEAVDSRSCRVVELRYFSGLTIEETAELLNISAATVKRDWQFAKAWLYREIQYN